MSIEVLGGNERHCGSEDEKLGHVDMSIVSAICEAVETHMHVREQIVREIMGPL